MLVLKRLIAFVAAVAAFSAVLATGPAFAAAGIATNWQMNLQDSASPVMDDIVWFHNLLLYIIVAITLFVLALLIIVMVKFNAKANPVPTKTTHNTLVEVAWTVIPVVILFVIAIPSFKLLFFQGSFPPPDVTIKATGKQWYWTYAYPDAKFEFDSLMLQDKERKPDQPRLLSVDNEIVVPVNKNVLVQVTGADVIHAFSVPSFGIKIDAIPGRLNETWFRATREGTYHGQCSELCGKDHAYMPITVKVVNDREYSAWLDQAKKKFANTDNRPVAVATSGDRQAQ